MGVDEGLALGGSLYCGPFDEEENLQTAAQVKEEAFSSFGAASSLRRFDVS
jgi:hypothetical protein